MPIQRVVVLMMENNSFDRMLGCMRGVRPAVDGVDPDHPGINFIEPLGQAYAQEPTTQRNIADDPQHDLDNVLRQMAGRNGGFVADFAQAYPSSGDAERRQVMAYYPHGFLPALHFLADQFVVSDRWFCSVPGPTWPNRFFAHSGTSLGHTDMPEGVFNPNLHIYDQRTLYDELQQAGISWRFYYGDIPQSLVLTHQLSYLDHYRKWDRWEPDLAAGDLPDYVFIEPTYFGPGENDQHPPHDVLRGDALIAQVYNGLLSRPDLFANTLLIVLYDEHGGFYDHVPPLPTVPPDQYTQSFGFNVLGPRVPTLLISPLLDPGVTHTVFDHTSLLKLASELWGVAPLGARTAQSHSVLSAIRLRPTPRTDLFPAPAPQVVQAVADQPLLDGRKQSLFDFTHYLESRLPDGEPKRQLMARAHEEMGGAFAQAKLATDRLDAFMKANTRPEASGRV